MTDLRIDGRRLKDREHGRRVSFADGLHERWLSRHGLRFADLGVQMQAGKDGTPEPVYVQALFDKGFNKVWSDALPKWLVDVQAYPAGYRLKSLLDGMESLGIRGWPPSSWTGSYRRQPKGRRAKSGQWAKRTPCPVRVGVAVGLEHGKIRMAEQRRLFPDYFKGEPPQATYNPNGDQGAW